MSNRFKNNSVNNNHATDIFDYYIIMTLEIFRVEIKFKIQPKFVEAIVFQYNLILNVKV